MSLFPCHRKPSHSQHRADNRQGENHWSRTPTCLLWHAPHLAPWHQQCCHRRHKTLHLWWEDGDWCCHVVYRPQQPSVLQLPTFAVQDWTGATVQRNPITSDPADIRWQVDAKRCWVFTDTKSFTCFLLFQLDFNIASPAYFEYIKKRDTVFISRRFAVQEVTTMRKRN